LAVCTGNPVAQSKINSGITVGQDDAAQPMGLQASKIGSGGQTFYCLTLVQIDNEKNASPA
jgi:hypothetical protein